MKLTQRGSGHFPSFKSTISRKTALPLILGVIPFIFPETAYAAPCPSPVNNTTISVSCDGAITWTGGFLTVNSGATINAGNNINGINFTGYTVTNLTNSGTITNTNGFYTIVSNGNSSITNIINNNGATISGSSAALAWNPISVGTIENHGLIESTNGSAILNYGNINTINNYSDGTIKGAGGHHGIYNVVGSIGSINNFGVISTTSFGYGIRNLATLTTLTNAQGLNGSGGYVLQYTDSGLPPEKWSSLKYGY
jgi:hypothetical protein